MLLYTVSGIVADIPDAAERGIQQIKHYGSEAIAFVGHAALAHPNEFVIACSAIVTAAFTGILAFKTRGLFQETAGLREETAALARFARQQAEDMKTSIKEARRAADVAERTLVLTTRPWIGIKVEIAGPLRFTATECTVDIKVIRRNYGRSPALNAGYHLNFEAGVGKAIDTRFKLEDAVRKRLSIGMMGNPMFPADPHEDTFTNSISRAELEEARQSDEKQELRLFVIACTFYTSPTGGRVRYTSLDWEIVRKGAADYGFVGVDEEIAPDQLELLGPNLGEAI